MGNYLSSPNKHKSTYSGVLTKNPKNKLPGLNLYWGACEMQGWRTNMEDVQFVTTIQNNDEEIHIFGVLDGHGG